MDHIQTKMNPKPAVLIISDRWGSPFQGGIPAAVRLLARLFNSLGFVIYCTVLKVSEEEDKDAKELNVTLVPPKLRGSLEWEEKDKPCRKWLLSYESYFENLKNLANTANIKIVVGFALVTSEASCTIKDNVFATAKYYITNLWPCDNLPPSILGCSKEVLSKFVKMLQEIHHKEANAVTSIDHQTFNSFCKTLKTEMHFQILPTPEDKFFSLNPSNLSPEITIFSCLEEHDELQNSAHINLSKEVNFAAKNYHKVYGEQLKWVIHGVQSTTEDDIIDVLKPFRNLKIVPKPMISSWSIESDLHCSNLVLIPPESPGINSLHLLISTLATGIPLLVDLYSPCHDFIKTYFSDYVDDIIVDMTTDPEVLAKKILYIFNNYQCCLKKAAAIKKKFKNETVALIADKNRRFIAHVRADPHFAGLLPSANNGNGGNSTDTEDSEIVESDPNSQDNRGNMELESNRNAGTSDTQNSEMVEADNREIMEHGPKGNARRQGDKAAMIPDENPQTTAQNNGQETDDQNAGNDASDTQNSEMVEADNREVMEHEPKGNARRPGDKAAMIPDENTQMTVQQNGQETDDQNAGNDASDTQDPEIVEGELNSADNRGVMEHESTRNAGAQDVQNSEMVETDNREVMEHEPNGNTCTSGDKTANSVADDNPQMTVQNVGQETNDQNAGNDASGRVSWRYLLQKSIQLSWHLWILVASLPLCYYLLDSIGVVLFAIVSLVVYRKLLAPSLDVGKQAVLITESAEGTDPKNNMGKKTSSGTKGHPTICVIPTVIPEENQPVAHVTKKYKTLPEVVKETPNQIKSIYPGIEVEDIKDGSIIYHVKCTTLDALNYLWHYYTSQKLHKLITSTTVTKKTLAIIGAVYLELQVTMDIEEYRQCKLELTQKGVNKLLLLGMDRSLKHSVGDLSWLLTTEKYIRQKGRQFDILHAVMTMTDRVQHILSSRQDVLALLGVTRYLVFDAANQDLTLITTEGLEEQLIQNGTQVPLLTGTDENCSSLVQSLLSPKPTITKVTYYWVEHLLKLGNIIKQSRPDAEKIILQNQLSDARQEKASLDEILKKLEQKFESDVKKVTKSFSGHTTKEAALGKVVPQSELDLVKKLLLDEQREAKSAKAILENQIRKQTLELEKKHKMVIDFTEKSDQLSVAKRETARLEEQVRKQALELEKREKIIQDLTENLGRWSGRPVKSLRQQQMKRTRGLTFHQDKLLICDRDNNIVHILNKDYTCQKELGSFSGQFEKPFHPQSIVVSQDNLYFILDENNIQIVVCDQNSTIINIITLPSELQPICIALVKRFVIITDVKVHRVLKYSLDGEFKAEVGSHGFGPTKFICPYFVTVNSRDVILVSDWGNHCIKCFDVELNYLYQFGWYGSNDGQLFYPHSIAVDGNDNVYVCDSINDRIVKWSYDRKWLCNLFEDDAEVRTPWYMAVTAHGSRIAVEDIESRVVVFSEWKKSYTKCFSKFIQLSAFL